MAYAVQLLGVPQFTHDGRPRDIPASQALLLVAFLAHHERWLSRQQVAGLFWPAKAERAARHSLSQLIYSCKDQPWARGLQVERSRLRFAADTDLARFRTSVAQGNWRDALRHHRGDFLASIEVDVSPEFEAWLAEARRELHASWRDAASAHSDALMAAADPAAAAALLTRILQRDELAEDALQRLLACSLELGGRERLAALERFERFRRTLRSELAVDPLPRTLELVEAVTARPAAPRPPATAPREAPREAPLRGFPSHGTAFVGRDAERAELDALLQRPDVRLVTLLGPGGVGKTRLATRFAADQAGRFADGAVFVPLAALDDPELVASSLLRALAVATPPQAEARTLVLEHLRERSLLLVFDNFEPVLDATDLLPEILDASPGSCILATSRTALELPGEHVYDLPGLSFPATPEDASEDYDAVRLFVRSAQRFRPAFRLDTQSGPHVAELCRLLEGSALGLELAATWLRVLPVAEIVREVRLNLDFLASENADRPARHRSLRAVFDTSWQLLSDEERRALTRLSVFRGGFARDAAQAVAEVPARTLLSLVNKSLLQRTRSGRFERHLTVQRFSAEKLPASEERSCRLQHARFFADLAARFREATNGPLEQEWVERVRDDLDNVRAALHFARTAPEPDLGVRVAVDLRQFWYHAGLVAEGKALLAALLALPPSPIAPPAEFPAESPAEPPLESRLEPPGAPPGGPASPSALPPRLRAQGYEASGELHRLSGDFAGARALFEESLRLFVELDDEHSRVHVANGLGIAAYLDGDAAAARRAWREGLALAERLDDANATANLSVSLGFLAKDDGDYEGMSERFGRALAIYERMEHRFAIMTTKSNLGFAALQRRDLATSLRFQREALQMALDLEHDDSVVRCLEDLAALAAACGEGALALQLAATTAAQRAALDLPLEPPDAAFLEAALAPARAELDAAAASRAVERGEAMDLRDAAREAFALELAATPERARER